MTPRKPCYFRRRATLKGYKIVCSRCSETVYETNLGDVIPENGHIQAILEAKKKHRRERDKKEKGASA